ncbi:hypothetical protein [Streptomyces sp. NPDC059802]|uniref:hypothetical protein n=1 Tax=Streptomyces sp. NPDC059802 TaxID=3346952 RepID=UPI0036572DA0
MSLHESPERGFFWASGTVEELAEQCAGWFESVGGELPAVRSEVGEQLRGTRHGMYESSSRKPRSGRAGHVQ